MKPATVVPEAKKAGGREAGRQAQRAMPADKDGVGPAQYSRSHEGRSRGKEPAPDGT
jgi:hypothetical protein